MQDFLVLASDIPKEAIVLTAMGVGMVIAVVAVVGGYIQAVMLNRQREQSRREIAAYVAEGSMSAEEGERLLKAGRSPLSGCGSRNA